MNKMKAPKSLRFDAAINSVDDRSDNYSGTKVSAVASLIAVASFTGAEAQQTGLPPVTVDAPVARPRPAAAKPTPDQVRARTALRRPQGARSRRRLRPCRFPTPAGSMPTAIPTRTRPRPTWRIGCRHQVNFPSQSSTRRRSITVLTKDVLADKNATTLKRAILNTAGVTLGTGEGGNAFGDRFFIRGFDARNDIFLDGIRDAGVSVRENFFTEQVEILRGPGSSFAGRGITGGAINIVTKQATTENSFYNMDTTFGTDQTKRVVLDVNQVISPTLAVRAGGLFQDAGVAGRDYIKDDRDGGFITAKWTPLDAVKLYATYIHTDLHGLPDFGVPYYRPGSTGAGKHLHHHGRWSVPGFRRQPQQFLRLRQSRLLQHQAGHRNAQWRGLRSRPISTLSNKTRVSALGARLHRHAAGSAGRYESQPASLWTLSANPQSRYQVTRCARQPDRGDLQVQHRPDWKNTALVGVEVSREIASIDKYAGLSSEALPGGFSGTGSLAGVSIFTPQFTFLPFHAPTQLTGLPTKLADRHRAASTLIDTANYNDFVILNGGIRYDDYSIKRQRLRHAESTCRTHSTRSRATIWPAELQPRPHPQAAAERQRLCRLCDLVEPGRCRIRRHQRARMAALRRC